MVWDDLSTLAITAAACATGTNSTATSAARIIALNFTEVTPSGLWPGSFHVAGFGRTFILQESFSGMPEKIKTPPWWAVQEDRAEQSGVVTAVTAGSDDGP